MREKGKEVALSLISHTNIGKTTLARTLLRRDIGLVADRAHVTLENQKYTVLQTETGESLQLWDTPGFPNCQKILKRLRGAKNPILKILAEVWDRFVDTPSWCAQQAVSNVQQEADLILYLVNASEEPMMAGYLPPELQLLDWIGKPVIVLLNQTGPPKEREAQQRLEQPWTQYFAKYPFVRSVQSLDAFSRCWVQEGVLFDTVRSLLPPEKSQAMGKLFTSWQKANLEVFHASMDRLGMLLVRAAMAQTMTKGDGSTIDKQKQQAVEALLRELKNDVWAVTQDLITLHGLEGNVMSTIQARMEDVEVQKTSQTREDATLGGTTLGGLGGGIAASGAYAGLHMDAATGGFSMGLFTVAGALIGGVLGFLGGEAWAESQEGKTPQPVTWSSEYLDLVVQDSIIRYLAIAHFGRGQGQYMDDPEHPKFWKEGVHRIVSRNQTNLHEQWTRVREKMPTKQSVELSTELTTLLTTMTHSLLRETYPEGKQFMTPCRW